MVAVSVVIPTYNRCASLKKAIASVLDQSYKNFEIIVVDDGSQDDTKGYLRTLTTPQVKVFHLSGNCGGNFARNYGIQQSQARYIAFLDDDDTFTKNKLATALPLLRQNQADLFYSGKYVQSSNRSTYRYSFKHPHFKCPCRSIMADNFIGVTSSVIVRRDALIQVSGFDCAIPALQDYDLYIRLIKQGCTLVNSPEPLIVYSMVEDSRKISSNYTRFKMARIYLLRKYQTDPYYGLLRRALLFIGIKKIIKSKHFLKEVLFPRVRHSVGQTLNVCL